MLQLFDINIDQLTTHLTQLMVAFILPIFTAWDREKETRTAGLRTFPLVSMAACTFTIIAMTMFADATAQARVIGGVITGIGFIGGGAILKGNSKVSGTSTAAAIWSTGAVGIATGMGRLELALVLSLMTFITFKAIGKVKKETGYDEDEKKVDE